ncbi:hypothetical protein NL108_018616 [Boleophthalmus pectinirostris]|nr:hypothetical protein NL108_018616 [Boleophthalmus pectinirostris]
MTQQAGKVFIFKDSSSKCNDIQQTITEDLSLPSTEDPAECDWVIVFCLIRDRRSDVQFALEQLPEPAKTKPVILVAIHHTWKKNDPDIEYWSIKHERIVLTVSVLFHEDKGLFRDEKYHGAMQNIKDMCNYMTENKSLVNDLEKLKQFGSSLIKSRSKRSAVSWCSLVRYLPCIFIVMFVLWRGWSYYNLSTYLWYAVPSCSLSTSTTSPSTPS